MPSKLHKAMSEYRASRKQLEIPGVLGITKGGKKLVEVPDRGGFMYVRLRENTSELIQAFNDKVSPVYNLPVLVTRQGNRYIVTGRDSQRYGNWGATSSYLPRHGAQHQFNGGDTTWIDKQQFTPMLGYPSGTSLSVYYYLDHKEDGSFGFLGAVASEDLILYKPTDDTALMLLVYMNRDTGALGVAEGSPFSAALTTISQIAEYIPSITGSSYYPVSAIRLVSGTSSLEWDNVFDVRQFFKEGGGTGGGTSYITNNEIGVVCQNEGVYVGTGTTLNFVGSNVDVSISGTIFRVFITGSAGSADPPITGSVVISDDNTIQGSALILNFGDNLSATISGSIAQIDILNVPAPVNTDGVIIWDEGSPIGTGSVLNFTGNGISALMSGTIVNISVSAVGSDYILVRDEKPNGTDGGTNAANAWTAREINTEVTDTGGYCSLSSGTVILEAGTYIADIVSPFYGTNAVTLRLRNITDNATTLLGISSYALMTHARLVGKFTIAAQKVFEIQYIAEFAQSDYGLGTSVGLRASNYADVEIYTSAQFWKTG
jgi:hypothetical protein